MGFKTLKKSLVVKTFQNWLPRERSFSTFEADLRNAVHYHTGLETNALDLVLWSLGGAQ